MTEARRMVALDGGTFIKGSDRHYPEERPAHEVTVAPFQIDAATVTNAEFARFVEATGYRTSAEVAIDPATAPDMPKEYFQPGSLVFHMTSGPVDLHDFRQWWRFVPGANWRHPEGPESDLHGREDHPVVHISLHDALAYCAWRGVELPTETQWEFAARDGVETDFPWGNTLTEGGKLHANTWHGAFPWQNELHDTAPFSWPSRFGDPSRYGLFNMIGNVWEWTRTPFQAAQGTGKTCCTPTVAPNDGDHYVVKGGSFLCAPSYCQRYRATARSPEEARSSTNHLGFRCVLPAAGQANR